MTVNKTNNLFQVCGIHPLVATLAIAVDVMLFGGTSATLGVGWLVSLPVSIVIALIGVIIQKKSFGDGWLVSIAKGMSIGLLVAIPTPIPSVLIASTGFLGFIKKPKQIE